MAAARPDTWMPLYIGDYLADTLHLTREQHGSYLLLIFALWRAGGSIPDDDRRLAAIAKTSPKEWKADRATLEEFFVVEDGVWRHKRVDAELAAAQGFITQRSDAGRASAEKRKRQRAFNERSTKQPTEGQREGQREGKTSPSPSPSPDLTTTESVANSARAGASQPRSTLIDDDWEPGESEIAALKAERPDMTDQVIAERMRDFRDWCAANATRSFNPAATWRGFMRKTKPANGGGETWDQRRIREAMEAIR